MFKPSIIFNILCISKGIQHQHSAHCSDCVAPSPDPPTPVAWFVAVSFVMFVPSMNCAFFLYTDPVIFSRGTKTRARTIEWDMTAEHTVRCLCEEHKCPVDEPGHFDDAAQLVSQLNCYLDDIIRSRKPLQGYLYIYPAWPPCFESRKLLTHPARCW
jgi:hypothetical protein